MQGVGLNINYKHLNSNIMGKASIPTLTGEGNIGTRYDGYNNLVKNFVYSNIRSHELTKQDGTKQWITDIHPSITYTLSNNDANLSSAEKASKETKVELETKARVEATATIPQEVLEQLSPAELAAIESLERTMKLTNTFESRRNLSTQERETLVKEIVDARVSLMSDMEFRDVADNLQHTIISGLDFNEPVTVGMLRDKIENAVEDQMQPIIDNYKGMIESFKRFPELSRHSEELQSRIDKLTSAITEKDKLTGTNGMVTKNLNKIFGLNLAEEFTGENEFDSDNNFRKSSMEKDIKLSYSNRLKMTFFGIKALRDNSSQEQITDLTGLPKFEDPDYVDLVLKSVTTEIPSNWDTLMQKLDTHYQDTKKEIFNQLRNTLKELPPNLKNEVLYKLVSSRFTAHKILNSVQKGTGNNPDRFVLTVLDENGNKETLRLKNQIVDNFTYDSPLTMVDVRTNERILKIQVAKGYQAAFAKHKANGTFDSGATSKNIATLKEIFQAIGVEVSDNTIEQYLAENNPFDKTQGLLTYVSQHLDTLILKGKDKVVVVTDEGNNLFYTSNKALNTLVEKEIALNGSNIARSIRVAGKTLQGVIQNTAASDTMKELLADNSELLELLYPTDPKERIGYYRSSLLLEQIKNNPQIKEILSLSYSSPDSYKENGKDSFLDTGFDKLSDTDGYISAFGLHTNERGHTTLANAKDIRGG